MKKLLVYNKFYNYLILFIIFILLFSVCNNEQYKQKSVTKLIQAIKDNKLQSINEISKDNKELNEKDETGWTALHYASVLSNAKIIEILIDNGANTEIKNNEGNTPLMEAIQYQMRENVIKLLEKGANPNTVNNSGNFPLLYIMEFDQSEWIELAELLLENGALINKSTREGMNCLHFAVNSGNYEYTKYLLKNRADINIAVDIEWDSLIPSDFLAYITKEYTDIIESTEEDDNIRNLIGDLLVSYGSELRAIPNTIGRFGCLFISLFNILSIMRSEKRLSSIDILDLPRAEYFEIRKNSFGGEDPIIPIRLIKKMIEDNTSTKVRIVWYKGIESQNKLEEIIDSEQNCFIIADVGGHPAIKQHWVRISSYRTNIKGEILLDKLETFRPLKALNYKKRHVDAIIVIEVL